SKGPFLARVDLSLTNLAHNDDYLVFLARRITGTEQSGAILIPCHSERSVPRFCFCAKRRDTQSRISLGTEILPRLTSKERDSPSSTCDLLLFIADSAPRGIQMILQARPHHFDSVNQAAGDLERLSDLKAVRMVEIFHGNSLAIG